MKKILIVVIIIYCNVSLIYPCSIFNKKDGENYLIGKNEDWINPGYVEYWVKFRKSQGETNGYVIFYLEYHKSAVFPYDGINDKGLYCGECSVPKVKVSFPLSKQKINQCDIIEQVLKKCSTIDEAIKEFNEYSINFLGDTAVHYMVADKTGKSVIIEFVGNEMLKFYKTKNYQCMTNFYLSDVYTSYVSWNGRDRYAKMIEQLENNNTLTVDYGMSILRSIIQNSGEYDNTIVSAMYDMRNMKIYIAYMRDFNKIISFDFFEELKKGNHEYKLSAIFK